MFCNFIVAEMTRKPASAALELQRNDVVRRVIMRTARFRIYIRAANLDTADYSGHAGTRSRGQISTSTAPTTQHTIIIRSPLVNEPLR